MRHENSRRLAGLVLTSVAGLAAASPCLADCNPAALADSFGGPAEFLIDLAPARLMVNGNPSPTGGRPEFEQSAGGTATLTLGEDGTLGISHSDAYLTGIAPFILANPWPWEAETTLFLPPPDVAQAVLGCTDGDLPRWRLETAPYPGVTMWVEFVMADVSVLEGRLFSLSGDDRMRFEMERPISLFRN